MRIPDYYVRFVDFPPTVLGATLPNDDGTFSVYINARLGDDARRETLRHELEHMARDHGQRCRSQQALFQEISPFHLFEFKLVFC